MIHLFNLLAFLLSKLTSCFVPSVRACVSSPAKQGPLGGLVGAQSQAVRAGGAFPSTDWAPTVPDAVLNPSRLPHFHSAAAQCGGYCLPSLCVDGN